MESAAGLREIMQCRETAKADEPAAAAMPTAANKVSLFMCALFLLSGCRTD